MLLLEADLGSLGSSGETSRNLEKNISRTLSSCLACGEGKVGENQGTCLQTRPLYSLVPLFLSTSFKTCPPVTKMANISMP